MSHRSAFWSSRDSTGTSVPFLVTITARTMARSPSIRSFTYLIRSPPNSPIFDRYVCSRSPRKIWTNSCFSAGVRCCQWSPRARWAVSDTSKASLATARTASTRSGGVIARFSSTSMTRSVYARSCSVGELAQAGPPSTRTVTTAATAVPSITRIRRLLLPIKVIDRPGDRPIGPVPRTATHSRDRVRLDLVASQLHQEVGEGRRPDDRVELAPVVRDQAHAVQDHVVHGPPRTTLD